MGRAAGELRLPGSVVPCLSDDRSGGDEFGSGAPAEFDEPGDATVVAVNADQCTGVKQQSHAALLRPMSGR